jgi:hypothetical protein
MNQQEACLSVNNRATRRPRWPRALLNRFNRAIVIEKKQTSDLYLQVVCPRSKAWQNARSMNSNSCNFSKEVQKGFLLLLTEVGPFTSREDSVSNDAGGIALECHNGTRTLIQARHELMPARNRAPFGWLSDSGAYRVFSSHGVVARNLLFWVNLGDLGPLYADPGH